MQRAIALHAAWIVLLGILGPGTAAKAQITGSAHDFTDNGFTGGGTCAACHVPHGADPSAGRLYPRPPNTAPFASAPARLCLDCHDGTMPVGQPGWPASWEGQPPPPLPAGKHELVSGYEPCGVCHPHAKAFRADTDDCLHCHDASSTRGWSWSSPPDGYDAGRDPEVGKFLDSPPGTLPAQTIRSEHNLRYERGGDLATPADNECRKCHGTGHPGSAQLLVGADTTVYPDVRALDPADPAYNDFSLYEAFCLGCHNAMLSGASTGLGGAIDGSETPAQVPPSNPADGSRRQSSPPWVVPAVPPSTPSALTPTPYFAHWEENGHGAPIKRLSNGEATLMDRTCLAGGRTEGCHTVHGSRSRYLIDDGALFAPDLSEAKQFATNLCYACHEPAVLGSGIGLVSLFHAWMGDGGVLHDDSPQPAQRNGMSQWRVMPTANMNINAVPSRADGVLPFYADPAAGAPIEERTYVAAPDQLSDTQWVHCLTCHDPHGTANALEAAMLRQTPTTLDYDDPLCGQCHS